MTPEHPDSVPTRVRRWPTVVLSIVASVALVAAGLLAASALILARAPSATSLGDAKQGIWSSVTLSQPAANGDGSPYQIYVKPGSSQNLMIFFGDGGLNWSDESATQPVTFSSSVFGGGNFYSPNVPFYIANTFGGMLSTESRNPFRDFTSVYIPTTTGDLGIGDGTASFRTDDGKTVTSEFNGYNNTSAALAWVYANVADPAKVLVAGSGTGGLTAAFWLSPVGDHYADAPLYEYSDSAYYAAADLAYVIDPVWHAQFENRFGYSLTGTPLKDAVTFNTARYGDRLTTLVSQSLLDKTNAAFSADLDDNSYSLQTGGDWNYGMKQTLRTMLKADQPPQLFLTDFGANRWGETQHILAPSPAFWAASEDGVTLDAFLSRAVIDGHPVSAGVGYLTQ
ncbi:hypothetical protein [Subtercola sp. YIM 133946]|uniref:hypothetical protein n=1 Tax=Subtercola sp. YIM 133946 TaxID=3118909 RepID=UPI002F93FC37